MAKKNFFVKKVQHLLSNIVISITTANDQHYVYCRVYKNGHVIDSFSREFDIEEHGHMSALMRTYLNKIQSEHYFTYIAFLDNGLGQGGFKGTDKKNFALAGVDFGHVSYIHVNNSWTVYSSNSDLIHIKNTFKRTGLDFIYSPFAVMYTILKRRMLFENEPVVFLLNQDDSVAIAIFESNELLFASFFRTKKDDEMISDDWKNEDMHDEEDLHDEFDLEMLDGSVSVVEDEEEDEDTDVFSGEGEATSDIEDLSAIDEDMESVSSDAFADTGKDKEENIIEQVREVSHGDIMQLKVYSRNMVMYDYLKKSLKEYYENPVYGGSFINKITILDAYDVSGEVENLITDELFMELDIQRVDLSETICDMAFEEGIES